MPSVFTRFRRDLLRLGQLGLHVGYSRRQRAHILGLTYDRPDPEQPRMPGRKTGRNPDPLPAGRSCSERGAPVVFAAYPDRQLLGLALFDPA
jgi:hypothetical protein